MDARPDTAALKMAIERLKREGVVPAIAERLETEAEPMARELLDTVLGEVGEFKASGNPELIPELEAVLAGHVARICQVLGTGPAGGGRVAGGPLGDFAALLRFTERRAAQKFPLDALLQSTRCLQRVLSVRVRDAALEVADKDAQVRRVVAASSDVVLEYAGIVSSIVTNRYVQHTRLLAEAEGDRRTTLMNTLLDGYDESDAQAARLLRRAGYLEQRQSYCVVVARSVNPAEMQNTARAQRMVDAMADALSAARLRVVAGIRDGLAVAVVSGTRRQSGWTAPQSLLAERIYEPLRRVGPAALIGLSNDVPSTSHIPRALHEARFALDFASVADRVLPYSRIPFRKLLVSHARKPIRAALPGWIEAFVEADGRAGGALAATLAAYADADMNVLRTAKALGLHPNTIYARMQRIEAITGSSPTRYHALTEMLLALDCAA